MYSLRGVPSFSRNKVKLLLLRFANDLEDFAKVDQMPVLEGKRMTIQLSPKKKEMPKKPAASKPVTQGQKLKSRKRARKNKKE